MQHPVSQGRPFMLVSVTRLIQRQCACGGSAGFTGTCAECRQNKLLGKSLQTTLQISEPGDAYEQEADRIAEQVMRMPEVEVNNRLRDVGSPLVQRRTTDGGTSVAEAPPIVHDALKAPGRSLDAATRAFFESRFGHDFSQVQVHADERAQQSARDVNAHAYTVGQDIVFGHGRYAPETADGRRLIAHELTHVLQQRTPVRGSRSPHIQRQGVTGGSKPPITETESCDPTLQSDLRTMHHPARDHVERAIASLDPGWKSMTPANRAAFSQYFDPSNSGQIDGGFVRTVRDKYKLIHSTMRSLRFDCDPGSWTLCGTSKKWCVGGRLMWTCFGNLHVCSNAYKTAAPNHKIETIIHESVHNALLTTDRAYSNEAGFRELSPRGTGFWGRVLNVLSNIPVLGILFRLLPGNKDTINNPDSYAGYAMQV
jgi:hypothetical protein